MEVIDKEVAEVAVPATDIIELDVSMLAKVAGGSGIAQID